MSDDSTTWSQMHGADDPPAKKPTLGVMPEQTWRRQRALDLARAIHERIESGQQFQPVGAWIEELRGHWQHVIKP